MYDFTRRIRDGIATVGLAWVLASVPALAAEPVGITGIDARAALVTAVDGARSRTIQFKVADAALLKTLQVGQIVSADLGAKKVSIHGGAVCCAIVNVKSGSNGSQAGAVANAAMNAPNDPLGAGGPPIKVASNKDFPNCSTCTGACNVCSQWNQECRCTLIATGSDPGPADDLWSCHCTGPDPKMPRK